jgi:hypothetical protein
MNNKTSAATDSRTVASEITRELNALRIAVRALKLVKALHEQLHSGVKLDPKAYEQISESIVIGEVELQ